MIPKVKLSLISCLLAKTTYSYLANQVPIFFKHGNKPQILRLLIWKIQIKILQYIQKILLKIELNEEQVEICKVILFQFFYVVKLGIKRKFSQFWP